MVMGGGSCSECCGFKSWHHILDGHFSHVFVLKIVIVLLVLASIKLISIFISIQKIIKLNF